eukprot:EG_transcript_2309
MAEYDDPHHMGESSTRLYLYGLKLAPRLNEPDAAKVLAHLLHPPDPFQLYQAKRELESVRAITPQGGLTVLGELVLAVPFELRLCLLLWYGACWGCLADAVVLACAIHVKDPFNLPFLMLEDGDSSQYRASLERSSLARARFDGGLYSEPLMLRRLFVEWWRSRSWTESLEANLKWFCPWASVSIDRFRAFDAEVRHVAHRLLHLCAPASTLGQQLAGLAHGDQQGVVFEEDPEVLRSLLGAAFCGSLLFASPKGDELPQDFDPYYSLRCSASPVDDPGVARAGADSSSESSCTAEEAEAEWEAEEEWEETNEEDADVCWEEDGGDDAHQQEATREPSFVDGIGDLSASPPDEPPCQTAPDDDELGGQGTVLATKAKAKPTAAPPDPDAVLALMRVISPAGLAKHSTANKAVAVQLVPRGLELKGPWPAHSYGAETPLLDDVAEEVRVALQFGEGRGTFCVPNADPEVEGKFLCVTKLGHPARLRWRLVGPSSSKAVPLSVAPNVRNPVGVACATTMKKGAHLLLGCCALVTGAKVAGVTMVPCRQAHFFLLAGLADSKLELRVQRDGEGELEVRGLQMAQHSVALHLPASLLQRIAALRRGVRCSVAPRKGSPVLAPPPECAELARQLSGLMCTMGRPPQPANAAASTPVSALSVAEVLDVLLLPKPCLAVVKEVLKLAESATLKLQEVGPSLRYRLAPGALQAAHLAWAALPGSDEDNANPVSPDGDLTDVFFDDVCRNLLQPADDGDDGVCSLSSAGASVLASLAELQLLDGPPSPSLEPNLSEDEISSGTDES